MDFDIDISEGGTGYTEKIEVDLGKQTELFQVPTHPGVDRSDVLHDFKNVSNPTYVLIPNPSLYHIKRGRYFKEVICRFIAQMIDAERKS